MPTVEGYRFPDDRWYDGREHVWVLVESVATDGDGVTAGAEATVDVRIGVDALGAELLGEVVYVELLDAAPEIRRGAAIGSLEAEKMVRPLLAPVTGSVLEVNSAVRANPRLLNQDPYGTGWLARMRATRWAAEHTALLVGERAVMAWAQAELEANRS